MLREMERLCHDPADGARPRPSPPDGPAPGASPADDPARWTRRARRCAMSPRLRERLLAALIAPPPGARPGPGAFLEGGISLARGDYVYTTPTSSAAAPWGSRTHSPPDRTSDRPVLRARHPPAHRPRLRARRSRTPDTGAATPAAGGSRGQPLRPVTANRPRWMSGEDLCLEAGTSGPGAGTWRGPQPQPLRRGRHPRGPGPGLLAPGRPARAGSAGPVTGTLTVGRPLGRLWMPRPPSPEALRRRRLRRSLVAQPPRQPRLPPGHLGPLHLPRAHRHRPRLHPRSHLAPPPD